MEKQKQDPVIKSQEELKGSIDELRTKKYMVDLAGTRNSDIVDVALKDLVSKIAEVVVNFMKGLGKTDKDWLKTRVKKKCSKF